MKWSLSEFLNHIELRSQTWCLATLGEAAGFSVPRDNWLSFYAVLEGRARLAGVGHELAELAEGDIAIVLSDDAHAIRTAPSAAAPTFQFLASHEYVDVPPSFVFGEGRVGARLLCGALKVTWPGGLQPRTLPPLLRTSAHGLFDLPALVESARGPGAVAVLNRLGNLIFVDGFRRSAECRAVFHDSSLHDPIARAQHYIEAHPFAEWTVESLARKVGMGRANFAARFVAQAGMTPFEALTGVRMRHAAGLLADTSLKVAEIAERVGYRSEAAFSRRFTAHFGQSPGAVRRAARGAD